MVSRDYYLKLTCNQLIYFFWGNLKKNFFFYVCKYYFLLYTYIFGLRKVFRRKKNYRKKIFYCLKFIVIALFCFLFILFFSHLVHNVTLHISRLLFIKVRLSLWSNSLLCKKKVKYIHLFFVQILFFLSISTIKKKNF